MVRMVVAQGLKCKGTWLVPFCLGCPLVYGFLAAGYFLLGGIEEITLNTVTAFCVLFHIAVQFSSAVLISAHVDLDRQAGQFANECRWSQHRVQTVLAKVLAYSLLLGAIAFVAGFSFWTFLKIFQIGISRTALWHLGCCLGISSFFMIPLLEVFLWAAYVLRMSGTLLVAVFFVLTGILFGTTGLGFVLWRFFPMSWGLKWLTTYAVLDTGSGLCLSANATATLLLVTCGLVVCLGGLLMGWFAHWENQSRGDE